MGGVWGAASTLPGVSTANLSGSVQGREGLSRSRLHPEKGALVVEGDEGRAAA